MIITARAGAWPRCIGLGLARRVPLALAWAALAMGNAQTATADPGRTLHQVTID